MERNEFIEGFGKISSDCNRMTEKHDIHYMIDNTSAAPNVRLVLVFTGLPVPCAVRFSSSLSTSILKILILRILLQRIRKR